jgi:hypothetical protein
MAPSKAKPGHSVPALIRAKQRHKAGETLVNLAREFGVTPTHLKRLWVEKLPPQKQWAKLLAAGETNSPNIPESSPAAGDEEDGEEVLPVDSTMSLDQQKQWLSSVMAKARRDADKLMRSRPDEARKFLEVAFKASNTLARISRNETDGDIRIPKDEIAALAAGARKKVMAAASRPLLCAHCSRELSIRWGKGDG